MSYTTIIFNANDAWGFDICSFKVNLVAKELSIYDAFISTETPFEDLLKE